MEATFNQLANQSNGSNKLLVWALACSILLHLFIAVVVPSIKHDQIEPEHQELKIELVQPKPPEPVVVPEPPKPEPIIEPVVKPKPIKKKVKPKPTPKPEPIQEPVPQEIVQETPPPPAVIAATPTPKAEPVFVAPEPPPPPPPEPEPTGPSESEINAARDAYRTKVQGELKRNQIYPKIALRRGIQGNVGLLIKLDSSGNVSNVSVSKSSGSSALDKEAIKTVKRSNIKQYMPDILRGVIDQITVTLSFKLAG